jgi:hypothetical protein
MTCSEAREILLTAEIDTLQVPDGPLADHLAGCAGCRLAIERILTAHAALSAEAERYPRTSAQTAARQATVRGRSAIRARRRVRLLIPVLLTAAGLAGVLLVPRDEMPPGSVPPAASRVEPPPIVEGDASHVAVIATNRPDVTVVWQF